ncbi:TBC1 domain family member 30-like [Genypterus blacodes]|uniref:TBC1 domain family member 30-like n=1 Tax=Genypterus blacodes TaxID=154954 RepID=UPI003F76BCF5
MSRNELLEVDIMDQDDESGVFVSCAADLREDFSAFQQWSPLVCALTESSAPGHPEPVSGHGWASSAAGDTDCDSPGDDVNGPRDSIVDCLLVELYETFSSGGRRNADSWDSSTEASGSDAFLGRSNSGSSFLQELQEKHTRRHQMNYLAQKAPAELHSIIQEVKYRTGLQSAKLLRQLRRRDRQCHKLQKNYDIITACLQAVSQKRRKSTHFTL